MAPETGRTSRERRLKDDEKIALSAVSGELMHVMQFPAGQKLLQQSIIKHRRSGQTPDELLQFAAADWLPVRDEALRLHEQLLKAPTFAIWDARLAERPASAEVIAFLLAIHGAHLAGAAQAQTSRRLRNVAKMKRSSVSLGDVLAYAALQRFPETGKYEAFCLDAHAALGCSVSTVQRRLRDAGIRKPSVRRASRRPAK